MFFNCHFSCQSPQFPTSEGTLRAISQSLSHLSSGLSQANVCDMCYTSRGEIMSNYNSKPPMALLEVLSGATCGLQCMFLWTLPSKKKILTASRIITSMSQSSLQFLQHHLTATPWSVLNNVQQFFLSKQLTQNRLSEAHIQLTKPALLQTIMYHMPEVTKCSLEHAIGRIVHYKAVKWANFSFFSQETLFSLAQR